MTASVLHECGCGVCRSGKPHPDQQLHRQISDWWWQEGQRAFPDAERLLVLADAGGSNSCRSRVWKAGLPRSMLRKGRRRCPP
jgi:Rhodopirellula transposase DDE domain